MYFITASSLIATISTVIGACLFAASVSPNIRGTNTMFIMMMVGRFFTGAACGSSRSKYSQTCVKRPPSKRSKIGFQDQLSLNAGQKYCRMLQREHSAILPTFIKLPFVIKIFVLFIFERPFHAGFTVVFQSDVKPI